MNIPELLAPVGSSEHLKTAILSGASSIYLSGEEFGARKYAENFNLAEIREAVKYAHFYNVKVYVTVNILIKEHEMKKVSEYVLELYKMGVDAVLVQDIGLVKTIHENIPDLPVHASTQMNIHNIEGIDWAYRHGIKRIVLPRETKLNELKELVNHAHSLNMEVEIFTHGALCYSYSGHCLLSSFQGGRSGNRGTCAQPCREPYELNINKSKDILPKTEGRYLLSPRDLSLYEHLDEIVNLGVDSLKIEGRMRSNDYVATVVSNYRQRLNSLKHDNTSKIINRKIENNTRIKKGKKGKNTHKKEAQNREAIRELKQREKERNRKSLEELELVFNREFTTGHLIPKNNPKIMNRRKPGHNGLLIGEIHRYNAETGEIHIALKDDLLTIPEKGDGILIEVNFNEDNIKNMENDRPNKSKQNNRRRKKHNHKKNQPDFSKYIGKSYNYGFDISANPVLRDPKDKYWIKREKDKNVTHRILIVKKVRANKRIDIPLLKGSKVYLTKRNSLLNDVRDLSGDKKRHSIKKSLLELYFRVDGENYPHLKGNLKLDNGKVITLTYKGENPFQEAINKPISNETIRKQLLKIGDLPYYIEKITVDNNKNLFAPISQVNELRRNFFDALREEIIKSYMPKEKDLKTAEDNIGKLVKNIKKIKSQSGKSKDEGLESDIENSEKLDCDDSQNRTLAVYINDLKILSKLSRLTLKDGKPLYDRVYLEIPPEKTFEEISKENVENYNPMKSNEINISYCVNFLKKAIEISHDKNYELIWKLPDIAHKDVKESIVKIFAIMSKMDLKINIMSSLIGFDDSLKDKFGIKVYGNYPLNAFNLSTILELKNYESLSISPELYSKDIVNLLDDYQTFKSNDNECEIPELELLVHGNIESMTSRKEIISKKQLKLIEKYNKKQRKLEKEESRPIIANNEFYLKSRKNQYYPIKRSMIEDQVIILNSEEFCLIKEIEFLKSKGLQHFSIDARWKSAEYIEEIGMVYRKSIDSHLDLAISQEIIKKYSDNASEGNFNTGLK